MLIQVGELAKRAGMTVRTLHHYEQTGLLTPSARSAAGYRLYNLAAVQRLHMIKALAQAGLELATIKDYLDRDAFSLSDLLVKQIATLDRQLQTLSTLRQRLALLREELDSGGEPDLESWVQTLELMKMYDRWFSQQELQVLPFAEQDEQRIRHGWSWWGKRSSSWTNAARQMSRGRLRWQPAGWSSWSRIPPAGRSF